MTLVPAGAAMFGLLLALRPSVMTHNMLSSRDRRSLSPEARLQHERRLTWAVRLMGVTFAVAGAAGVAKGF